MAARVPYPSVAPLKTLPGLGALLKMFLKFLKKYAIAWPWKNAKTAAAAAYDKLDAWMRDSVVEIVNNLREAPLLVNNLREHLPLNQHHHHRQRWSKPFESMSLVLKWEDVEVGEPKEGEVRVKNKAIGLNFIDVYFRKGVYKAATVPYTPGVEACGVVTAVGPGLTGRQVGDLVAYAGQPMGSYAEEQILPADRVGPVPPSIDPTVAASLLLKGMTAQFLLRSCFKVEPGQTVLVHAAAGGVGSLLCQWANALGATVIGTVSTKLKAAQAKEDGCHHVIIYKEEDFVA
ncbi:hypothetical protein ACE6H2_008776 [Prunus campanulata]